MRYRFSAPENPYNPTAWDDAFFLLIARTDGHVVLVSPVPPDCAAEVSGHDLPTDIREVDYRHVAGHDGGVVSYSTSELGLLDGDGHLTSGLTCHLARNPVFQANLLVSRSGRYHRMVDVHTGFSVRQHSVAEMKALLGGVAIGHQARACCRYANRRWKAAIEGLQDSALAGTVWLDDDTPVVHGLFLNDGAMSRHEGTFPLMPYL